MPDSMTNPKITPTPSRKTATAAKAQRDDSPSPSAAAKDTTINPATSEEDLPTLKELILKLDAFLAENAALRARNDELAKRVETLERLLEDKMEPSTTSSSISAPSPPAPDTVPKERYDALILSDSEACGWRLPT